MYGFVAMTVEIVQQVAIVAFMHDQNYCVVQNISLGVEPAGQITG